MAEKSYSRFFVASRQDDRWCWLGVVFIDDRDFGWKLIKDKTRQSYIFINTFLTLVNT